MWSFGTDVIQTKITIIEDLGSKNFQTGQDFLKIAWKGGGGGGT